MRFMSVLVFLLLLAAVSPAEELAATTVTVQPSLKQALLAGRHERFLRLLQEAELVGYLDKSDVTFFVPAEEYFVSLPEAEYRALAGDRQKLLHVLQNHTFRGLHSEQDLRTGAGVQSLTGEVVLPAVDDELGLVVNGLIVLRADVRGPDFVVHVVEHMYTE